MLGGGKKSKKSGRPCQWTILIPPVSLSNPLNSEQKENSQRVDLSHGLARGVEG